MVRYDILTELLRLDNRVCMDCWIILPHSLVGKEKEQFIVDYRAADAPTKLAEQIVHAAKAGVVLVGMSKRAAILVEGVQTRTVELEKSASVISVGAALGSHFYLRTRIAAVLGGISARQDLDFIHRFRVRGDNRCAAPAQTVRAHAVNHVVVCRNALAIRNNLNLVFNLEDLAVRAPGPLLQGEVLRIAVGSSCIVTEHTRCKPEQLVRIASKRWQVLYLFVVNCSGNACVFRLEIRESIAVNRH